MSESVPQSTYLFSTHQCRHPVAQRKKVRKGLGGGKKKGACFDPESDVLTKPLQPSLLTGMVSLSFDGSRSFLGRGKRGEHGRWQQAKGQRKLRLRLSKKLSVASVEPRIPYEPASGPREQSRASQPNPGLSLAHCIPLHPS